MPDNPGPVATVTGLYRATDAGLEPLTKATPLFPDEVRDMPVFFELELAEDCTDVIVDISYDNMAPVRLPDLIRGTVIPRGIRFWPCWFEVPPHREAKDVTGRAIFPRAPGVHTVRIRTAERSRGRQLRDRAFSSANRGWTSPLYELAIATEKSRPAPREIPGAGTAGAAAGRSGA